jgi:putative FmdB family regulatory protein
VPLYEYRCLKCGHQFEKIQTFSAPDEKECPVCKGEVERLISAPAFQFKGAGWYVNDYASKSSTNSAAKGAESSSDGKPAAASSEGKAASSSESAAAAPVPTTAPAKAKSE